MITFIISKLEPAYVFHHFDFPLFNCLIQECGTFTQPGSFSFNSYITELPWPVIYNDGSWSPQCYTLLITALEQSKLMIQVLRNTLNFLWISVGLLYRWLNLTLNSLRHIYLKGSPIELSMVNFWVGIYSLAKTPLNQYSKFVLLKTYLNRRVLAVGRIKVQKVCRGWQGGGAMCCLKHSSHLNWKQLPSAVNETLPSWWPPLNLWLSVPSLWMRTGNQRTLEGVCSLGLPPVSCSSPCSSLPIPFPVPELCWRWSLVISLFPPL